MSDEVVGKNQQAPYGEAHFLLISPLLLIHMRKHLTSSRLETQLKSELPNDELIILESLDVFLDF